MNMQPNRITYYFIASAVLLIWGEAQAQTPPKNWVAGGAEGGGKFTQTETVAHPWLGVDLEGNLRKSVAMPGANPFVTKSNQLAYAWLGTSASFVDLDGDGLQDLVSPDGAGIFWCWKNRGKPGQPEFGYGESMPLLVDDQRSSFQPIFNRGTESAKEKLTPSEVARRKKIDEQREKELMRLVRKNERRPKDEQRPKKELEQEVEERFPYEAPRSEAAAKGGIVIPEGGLTCKLNSFRRLRAVAAPLDWNRDGLVDFVVGDQGGTVYLARNIGRPGLPNFGVSTRSNDAIPLKLARQPGVNGSTSVYTRVEFMNYAMPYVCDWDGNGQPDLLVGEGTYSVNSIRLFPNVTSISGTTPLQEIIIYVGEERTFLAPFTWDWDGDGDIDLFVNDSKGDLTVHRNIGRGQPLEEPQKLTLEGGNAPLAYCAPQPCDWNADGILDIVWGDPYGCIQVALGTERGGKTFGPPTLVKSMVPARRLEFPHRIAATGVPARTEDSSSKGSNGGTANAEQYFRADGTSRENENGWPGNRNRGLHGIMPSWGPDSAQTVEEILGAPRPGQVGKKHASWAVAFMPGDIWEAVDELGAPGEGKTLLLRWHDPRENAIFRTRVPRLPHWTPGAAIAFENGRSGPFATHYTKKPITIRFHMKLEGRFSRLDVIYATSWGPLGSNGKPPIEGGRIECPPKLSPTHNAWFEYQHTVQPEKYERGLDGSLYIQLLGEGSIRIRDVRVTES